MEPKVAQQLSDILDELRKAEASWPFLRPVDWKALQLDDYPLIVTEPMDLQTVGKKLKNRQYKTPALFWRDVNLIWSNCKKFNSDTAEVFRLSLEMEDITKALKASFEETLKQKQPTESLSATARPHSPPSKRLQRLSFPQPEYGWSQLTEHNVASMSARCRFVCFSANNGTPQALHDIAIYARYLSHLDPSSLVAVRQTITHSCTLDANNVRRVVNMCLAADHSCQAIEHVSANAPDCVSQSREAVQPGTIATQDDGVRGEQSSGVLTRKPVQPHSSAFTYQFDISLLHSLYPDVFKRSLG